MLRFPHRSFGSADLVHGDALEVLLDLAESGRRFGAVLTDPVAAGIGLPPGCFSWGGIYGHSWILDPVRHRCVVALTNTAVEGMNGKFAARIAHAMAE